MSHLSTFTSTINDISPIDFKFNPNYELTIRDHVRDLYDQFLRRPFYKFKYKTMFKGKNYPINLVLPENGMSLYSQLKQINKCKSLKGANILVLGCGTARYYNLYFKFNPAKIVSCDLSNFNFCWNQVLEYAKKYNITTNLSFYQSDIVNLPKEFNSSFDIIVSNAVFEHCLDLDNVLLACKSLLKPNGVLYSSYGPLWYCFGGDHFSGKGGIQNGFNHLILDDSQYKEYFNEYVQNDDFMTASGKNYLEAGGLTIKETLFNKLASDKYFELYKRHNFKIRSLMVEFSKAAQLLLKNEDIKTRLLKKQPNLTADDFMIKSHYVMIENG